MSHKGDHSGFSEMLLGRGNIGGGRGDERADDKGDHDGFAEISCEGEVFGENNVTFDGGNDSAFGSGHGFEGAI